MPVPRHTAPITAQNVLPVIDEPWIRVVTWPIQTRPVKASKAPMTRLRITTEGPYARSLRLVCRRPAKASREACRWLMCDRGALDRGDLPAGRLLWPALPACV